MTSTEIVGWVAEVVKLVVEVVAEAVKGPEPPTREVLRASLEASLKAREGDWLKRDKEDADAQFTTSASDAFGGDTQP